MKKKKKRRQLCFHAIMDLMSDYKPRTAEMIADATGFSYGRVRSELAANFEFKKTKAPGKGRLIKTWHQLERHSLPRVSELPSVAELESVTSEGDE